MKPYKVTKDKSTGLFYVESRHNLHGVQNGPFQFKKDAILFGEERLK
jgi:guanyl-specific ribonuclease Sa